MSAARFDCMARLDCLAGATDFAEDFCARHAIDRQLALRLVLVVEELFTNTVMHGHGGDSDAPVQLLLHAESGSLCLDYGDTAPAFDPLEHLQQEVDSLQADLSERPIGHLGIVLVCRLASRADYERRDGWNRLRLALDLQT